MEEYEISPGIYVTDYRKKREQGTSPAGESLSPEEFLANLITKGETSLEVLGQHQWRLELAIEKIKESNLILLGYPDDTDCVEAHQENIKTLEKQEKMLAGVIALLSCSGGVYL